MSADTPTQHIWVMVQINNGESSTTAHLTKEGAYNDIIDTCFEDPSWLGLDPDDQESAEILQRYRNQRDDFTAEQFYNGFIHGALEKDNGFWMEVQQLHGLDSRPPQQEVEGRHNLKTWTCEGEDGYSDETAPLTVSRRDQWIDLDLGDDNPDPEATGNPCIAIERRPGKWFVALSAHRGGDVNVLIYMADDGRIHIEGDGLPLASVDTRKLIPSHTMLTRPPQL